LIRRHLAERIPLPLVCGVDIESGQVSFREIRYDEEALGAGDERKTGCQD
jgi:hypothetical protein